MKLFAILRVAARALRRNKMRTILTMLGMIIGVGAVIATVSIGNGAKAMVEAQIASLGENVVIVNSGSITRGGVHTGFGSAGTLSVDDANAIDREIPEVVAISPEMSTTTQIAAGNQNWFTRIAGESDQYLDIRQWALSEGSMFTAQDVRAASKVCIIGQTIVNQLFPDGNAIGQVLRIKNVPFVVVGILTPKGYNMMGSDQDDTVIVPYTSSMKRLQGATNLRTINVQAVTADALESVQQQINELLRQRHRIGPGRDDDFNVRTQQEIAAAATATSSVMRLLLASIAGVSLVVGGIGIMNIMLVSVTERTREIGIRMAVGAHGRDIRAQFLIEAVTLSIVGGITGIAVGVSTSKILAVKMNWPTLTSVESIVFAFFVSAGVGILFGFYPAHKASQLDPIDALRYE